MTIKSVGVIGLGRMAMPIAILLLKGGTRVPGYRRSSMADFEAAGGIAKASPAEVAADCDVVVSCLPSPEALDEVVSGPRGLVHSVRPGQIVLELGTYSFEVKERQRVALAAKGAILIDGEISGTPGMVAERKSAVYIAGDAKACETAAEVVIGFSDSCTYFGKFGSAIQVKLIANLLVTLNIAASAEAMALAAKTGIEPNLLINAVGSGAGSSRQFVIRAPWMAERKFSPAQGPVTTLAHYFEPIRSMAAQLGVATPMLDRAIGLYETALAQGKGELDVACLVDVVGSLPTRSDN
jgi:3-hydroxyisobutyrate dehydrogenase-like beta-hydroxyacid dehydrogenase